MENESVFLTKRESRCLISVHPPFEVGSLAFLLAGGLVPLLRDHLLVSLPEVGVAARLLVAVGDRLPKTFQVAVLLPPITKATTWRVLRHRASHTHTFSLFLAINEGP